MPLIPLKKINRTTLWSYVFLLGITLVGYWPLSFGVFSVKNDAIHYFLPFRYNISLALQQGELPFWSPFIYLGYPLHGDMQSGAWNPFVWLISLSGTYDLTRFHLEYLLYLFISGAGMFRLSSLFSKNAIIRLIAATAYLLSGYMFGSGQFINWIASAAFMPFVLYHYVQLLSTGKKSHAIKTGVATWLLFVCGYPADLIYVFYLLLAILIATAWMKRKKLKEKTAFKNYFLLHLFAVLVCLGLSAPALISYIELLPYYERGGGTDYTQATQNVFELKNAISLLNPWATWAGSYRSATDPTGRNLFAGIFILSFAAVAFFGRRRKATWLLLGMLLVSFLFSLGADFFVHPFAFHVLPGMNLFRHPSHFRLYVLIPLILLAAIGLRKTMSDLHHDRYLKMVIYFLGGLCLLMAILSIPDNISDVVPGSLNRNVLKAWLQGLDRNVLLFGGLLLQTIFLALLLLLLKIKQLAAKSILTLHVVNLLLFQALFPVNFVSKTPPAVINRIIHKAPKQFNSDTAAQTLAASSWDAFRYFDDAGLYYFYNKKIGVSKITNSPSFLASTDRWIQNEFLYNYVSGKPVFYSSDSLVQMKDSLRAPAGSCSYSFVDDLTPSPLQCSGSGVMITDVDIGFNKMKSTVICSKPTLLNLTQNFHHNWKATKDGKPTTILQTNGAFMSVMVGAGMHQVQWKYSPRFVYLGLFIFGVTMLALLFAAFRPKTLNKPKG
jgi:hypothetical protein